MKLSLVLAAVLLVAQLGCQERLSSPSDCPELCPGSGLTIHDTVLVATLDLDSTYTGFLTGEDPGALLISNGLSAGEARAFAIYQRRDTTVFIDALQYPYTVDSVTFALNLIARDTAVRDLRLMVHRVPLGVDSVGSVAELDALLTPENLLDSVVVHDTLRSGTVNVVVKGDALERLAPSEPDSGRLAIAIRLNASQPTGVRLGAPGGGTSPPLYTSHVRALVSDTSRPARVLTYGPLVTNYLISGVTDPIPGVHFLGGKLGSRMLLRFELPDFIKDSAAAVRATLELTPAAALKGLPNDPGELQVRSVLLDLGAKSLAVATAASVARLSVGTTAVQQIDVRNVITTWFGPNGLKPALLLGLAPDGGTFARPEFLTTASLSGAPRIRLTYALPSHPGHP